MTTISLLKNARPIYHSEDDFKFAFSKALSKVLGNNYEIRLECPQYIDMPKRDGDIKVARAPIDIMIINIETNLTYPVELKYKTKKFETLFKNEKYNLTEHGATDIGRFSFRKDIFRIEQLLSKEIQQGFFIVITNDQKYLQDISDKDTLDKNFSFHNKAAIQKEDMSWNYEKHLKSGYSINSKQQLSKNGKPHWTSKGDEFYKLDLLNEYIIEWEKYSELEDSVFNISIVEIKQ